MYLLLFLEGKDRFLDSITCINGSVSHTLTQYNTFWDCLMRSLKMNESKWLVRIYLWCTLQSGNILEFDGLRSDEHLCSGNTFKSISITFLHQTPTVFTYSDIKDFTLSGISWGGSLCKILRKLGMRWGSLKPWHEFCSSKERRVAGGDKFTCSCF